jgi:pyruvate/2-oxoglutarate dehydrogenase complex dihydrolipoamide acyltransferase (E2) component
VSDAILMPAVGKPPVQGRVIKIHRMPGHCIAADDPLVDVQVDPHILTIRSSEVGILVRSRWIGNQLKEGDVVAELSTAAGWLPTYEVFVAYRRGDSPGHAGRVGERLMREFGRAQVFKDVDSLPPGRDFVDVVRERLQQAVLMVVIIGPRWQTLTSNSGARRLDDAADLHREEIRAALTRGIDVFPVLVDGATIPSPEDLPEDIRPLARRYAIEMSEARWEYDSTRLFEAAAETLWRAPARRIGETYGRTNQVR